MAGNEDEDAGVEVLDCNVSTTSSAITHQMDKKHLQIDHPNNNNNGGESDEPAAPIAEEEGEEDGDKASLPNSSLPVGVVKESKLLAAVSSAQQQLQQQQEQEQLAPSFDEAVPISHIGDGQSLVSSLQHSHIDKQPHQQYYTNNSAILEENEEYYTQDDDDEEEIQALKAIQRRNLLIIIMLLIFLGLVIAIGVGVGLAVNSSDNGSSINNNDDNASNNNDPGSNTGTNTNSDEGGGGGGIDTTEDLTNPSSSSTSTVPSLAPSYNGPCIPIELGIIFDEYSDETSWELVSGTYYPENSERNTVVWKSKPYPTLEYSGRADTFSKCFSPGYYTFVFRDREGDGICCYHGDGRYVLSSEGKVITIGGQMESSTQEETSVFELSYVEPPPSDTNGDGNDDRLGWIMPYDSSSFTEGVDCENFRLVILTDEYGVETTWELYEGQDKVTGKLIANGGPYGSEYTYVIDYCLASPKEYVLYMYDWDRRGLCCASGEGWYQVTSGDIVIRDKDSGSQFGEEDITNFVLPVGTVVTDPPTPLPTPSPTRFFSTIGPPTPLPTASPQPPGDIVDEGGLPNDLGGGGGDGDVVDENGLPNNIAIVGINT